MLYCVWIWGIGSNLLLRSAIITTNCHSLNLLGSVLLFTDITVIVSASSERSLIWTWVCPRCPCERALNLCSVLLLLSALLLAPGLRVQFFCIANEFSQERKWNPRHLPLRHASYLRLHCSRFWFPVHSIAKGKNMSITSHKCMD